MQIIKKLSEMISEEIDDAEKYIRCAIENKEKFPALSDLFSKLSDEELRHMALQHDQVTKMISEYRKEKGEPPAAMMAVYEYIHQQHIDHLAEVKILQEMYRNG